MKEIEILWWHDAMDIAAKLVNAKQKNIVVVLRYGNTTKSFDVQAYKSIRETKMDGERAFTIKLNNGSQFTISSSGVK